MLYSFQSRIHDKLLTAAPHLKVGADRGMISTETGWGRVVLSMREGDLPLPRVAGREKPGLKQMRATASKVFFGLSDNPYSVAVYTVVVPCSHGVGAASHHLKATFSGLYYSRQTGSRLLFGSLHSLFSVHECSAAILSSHGL